MKTLFALLLIFCVSLVPAQNLIPNPSFEDTITSFFGLKFAETWNRPTKGSPDYFTKFHNLDRENFGVPFNTFGTQEGNLGEAYIGLSIYALARANDSKRYREYIQNEMIKPLQKDSLYCLQLFVSLADSSRYASKNKLGVYFSNTTIGSNDFFYLPYVPQIMVSPDSFITEKEDWVEYTFQYQALGGEKFITIGNFTDSTEIDTLFVGGGVDEQWKETYYYIDDVYLGSCDSLPFDTNVGLSKNKILQRYHRIYPNPTTDQFQLELEVNPQEQMLLSIYDIQGKLQLQQSLQPAKLHQVNVSLLSKGMYLYRVQNRSGRMFSGKLMKE